MPNLETLSERELQKRMNLASTQAKQLCKALCAAGFGHETGAETRFRAKATGEPLATAWAASQDAFNAYVTESERRKRWRGSEKPIRNRTGV